MTNADISRPDTMSSFVNTACRRVSGGATSSVPDSAPTPKYRIAAYTSGAGWPTSVAGGSHEVRATTPSDSCSGVGGGAKPDEYAKASQPQPAMCASRSTASRSLPTRTAVALVWGSSSASPRWRHTSGRRSSFSRHAARSAPASAGVAIDAGLTRAASPGRRLTGSAATALSQNAGEARRKARISERRMTLLPSLTTPMRSWSATSTAKTASETYSGMSTAASRPRPIKPTTGITAAKGARAAARTTAAVTSHLHRCARCEVGSTTPRVSLSSAATSMPDVPMRASPMARSEPSMSTFSVSHSALAWGVVEAAPPPAACDDRECAVCELSMPDDRRCHAELVELVDPLRFPRARACAESGPLAVASRGRWG
mmetsp:Transcript_2827/g.9999  ORF Transcript_2827/g.9999 Transcript_2827/m.9999 type:complete len:372 (-) Transcript_2827:348-1463(-)